MTKFDHHPEIESYIEQKFGYLAHVALKMSLNNTYQHIVAQISG